MEYEVDLKSVLKGEALESMWQSVLSRLMEYLGSSKTPGVSQVEEACEKIAKDLGLCFYRRDNWLYFCDKELAYNSLN